MMKTLLDFSGDRAPSASAPPGEQPAPVAKPRLQSPSSILTYKQCPRKYFYRYIARLPSGKSIHLVRGSVTHKVLEEFYAKDLSAVPDSAFPITAKVVLHELFRKAWADARGELDELGLPPSQVESYYEETKVMVTNFFHYLLGRLRRYPDLTLAQALERVKPRCEIELRSARDNVRGYADAVHEEDGRTYILDYKTSARREVHDVHARTASARIEDYPMRPGPLCKWSTGQCEYYELCFGNRRIADYADGVLVQVGGRGRQEK